MPTLFQGKNGSLEIPDHFTSQHFWEAAEHVFRITNDSGQPNLLGKMLAQAAATEAKLEAEKSVDGAKW